MSFPRYPEYKDSGVEWLGEVPAHWTTKPLKAVSTCNDDVLDESTEPEYQIRYVEISGVDSSVGIVESSVTTFESAPSRARRKVKDGDVLISTVRTYLRAISPVIDPPENMIASTGFAVIRPRKIESRFLGYLVRSEFYIAEVIARSVGVSYPAINASELMRLAVPVPGATEQTAIATFLDRETAKIDELVAEQQTLIALLKEKRQAVISHAVTKGLNPDAPMKPSGIEWLGDVPAHWEIRRVKDMSLLLTSGPRGWSDRICEEGAKFVQSGDLKDGLRVDFDGAARVAVVADAESQRSQLSCGDVVVCITGAKTGNVAVCGDTGGDAYINQHLCLIRPLPEIDSAFLGNYLKSDQGQTYFEQAQYGLKQGLSLENVKEAVLPYPPLPEQLAIVARLNALSYNLDQLLLDAERAITLLKERRSALISAAVTGQIDVRGLAPA